MLLMASVSPPPHRPPITAINHTIYSTNPRIIYSPKSSCWGTIFGGCGKNYDPWEMRTYTSPDGMLRTFHDTHSRGNNPNSDQIRKLTMRFEGTNSTSPDMLIILMKIAGSAVFVYGAPKIHLLHEHGQQEVCLQDQCERIDVETLYSEAPALDRPVLLWSAANLEPFQVHILELRLLDSDGGGRLGVSFEYLEYMAIPTLPM